jgi:hypothetical protein
MPKGNVLKCPECGREYEQVNDEEIYCDAKRKATSAGHKRVRMK